MSGTVDERIPVMADPALLATIETRAQTCRACPCAWSRRRVVIYRGVPEPHILFVGQSPGEREDELGLPFVGPSGALLDEALITHRIGSYGIINIINCHPPLNDYQAPYGEACRPFFVDKLKVFLPTAEHLVSVGRDAQMALVEVRMTHPGLFKDVKLHHIIHPSAVLRDRGRQSSWDADWAKLDAEINGDR